MPIFKENNPGRQPAQTDKPANNTPAALSTQEQRGWQDIPHDALVSTFKSLIRQKEQEKGRYKGFFPPENIIRTQLHIQYMSGDNHKTRFFYTLLCAWDALAFDRYDPNDANEAADSLNRYSYTPNTHEIRQSVILSDPLQVKIINALADATGIPRHKGLTEIEIPERLRGENYWQWRLSLAYEQEEKMRSERAKMRQENTSA